MAKSLPSHFTGLLAYLGQPHEKANEDLALSYFRTVFGEAFTRQQDAKRADGYMPGSFVLELKGSGNDWLSGLFQGLAYKNSTLDFGQIVVAARNFLAIWQVSDLPEKIRKEIAAEEASPSEIGKAYSKKYSSQKNELLKSAIWNGAGYFGPLFLSQPDAVLDRLRSFEKTLKEGRKVRQRVTLSNFPTMLREMASFFDPAQPIKTVRAFYGMLSAWTDGSTVQISQRHPDQATLGGEAISNLIPGKRLHFKDFVEARYVATDADNESDAFFARYDEAIDAVDNSFRKTHGIFFTDLDLSRFAMWLVARHVPKLGQDYLVIDPACGSGNLVTNWRSPLELRHKVVSEIEPELLFAVERRMKGDTWHSGKFTVVPKVSEGKGLNFLDRSATEYLGALTAALIEKGQSPDKPLAFLCNPPYRSDDDQAAVAISYEVHPSIVDITGVDASNERYCSFLAQMKLICDNARSSGLPGDSLLLIFTKSAWLTKRSIFQSLRSEMFGAFEDVSGVLVNGSEFFDVKGAWPVAFTIWRYKGSTSNLNPNRAIQLIDLTWLTKSDLLEIPWADQEQARKACQSILANERSKTVELGVDRISIREWSTETMVDFKRDRRKAEKDPTVAGGLPLHDRRRGKKKTYGEADGTFVGFMDDLTPCRVRHSDPGKPWFRLNNQFMDVKKNRCLSGPPTNRGYCAYDLASAQKLFFWYALTRAFLQRRYPMWVDADDMWAPSISPRLERKIFSLAFAIGFAENECVETYFPANNPLAGTREIFLSNPMTPLDPQSFWSTTLRPCITPDEPNAVTLVGAVQRVYGAWSIFIGTRRELPIGYHRPYFIDDRPVTKTAGIVQIRDYATENDIASLLSALGELQESLRSAKDKFVAMVTAETGVNYFGRGSTISTTAIPEKTRFERVLCRRLAVAGLVARQLRGDPNFGRTKLAKLFYLADTHHKLALETEYVREAAGPLDQRLLYNKQVGIEALAQKYGLFRPITKGKMVHYEPLDHFEEIDDFAAKHLGEKTKEIEDLAVLFKPMTTDQSEIVATLYACWNDFLIQRHSPTDDEIITECVQHWHPKKARFSRSRLAKALNWMRAKGIAPTGNGRPTKEKFED
jgi:hypothetical protein